MARDGAEPRVLEAHFEYVEYDLELADAGARTGNPLAAFHLQQAAEKLVTAVRLHRGLLPRPTASKSSSMGTPAAASRRRSRRLTRGVRGL